MHLKPSLLHGYSKQVPPFLHTIFEHIASWNEITVKDHMIHITHEITVKDHMIHITHVRLTTPRSVAKGGGDGGSYVL
jgi:hypothetical protein